MTAFLRLLALLTVAAGTNLRLADAAPPSKADPCAKIAGKQFVPPADALACYKSFPFDESIRQNVLNNVDRVFDFFTFEDYYLKSPPPFQESTSNIRAVLKQLNTTKFATDYDFHKALYDFTTQLNDGHTRYFPSCYTAFQNLAPAPVVSLSTGSGVTNTKSDQGLYVVPDLAELVPLIGTNYTSYFDSIHFDWASLAGAQVLQVNGMDPYAYVDFVAKTVSGNYLDHGVRVNSVYSSYRILGGTFSQRFGDFAGPSNIEQTSIEMVVKKVGKTQSEKVQVPFLANYVGAGTFTDSASYWASNCVANDATNGVDLRTSGDSNRRTAPLRPKADIIDGSQSNAVGLPDKYNPTVPLLNGSGDVVKFFVLPGNQTGVMFVGSFSPADFDGFQQNIVDGIASLKAAGATRLIIDLSNNGGGFVCLGQFLFQYLAGTGIGYPGFVSSQRGNTLARKIVAFHAALGKNDHIDSFYVPDNWAFLNDTVMPPTYDYDSPTAPFEINGQSDPTSQRFHDTCEVEFTQEMPTKPPFDLSKVIIVSNGNCASTCAMFSTLMFERLGTKIGIFGGKPGESMEYKGMAGNQVLEWADLDTEIKSAGLKNDPLAPPDVVVDVNFRHNWRTAWSWLDESKPIVYLSEKPQFRFAYTKDTYNNPQALWTFAAAHMLS